MTQEPDLPQMVSYGKRITDLAVTHPDATAIVFAASDGSDLEISWRELDARSSQVARLLALHDRQHPGITARSPRPPQWRWG